MGKDRHPWLAGEVPYSLREVSFADDSGRFAIVAAVLGGLWWFYLRREWQARVFGNAVTCASEHPVRLRCQNRELVHVNGNNNIMGVDLGRGGVVWFRQFLGRGRNGMWLSHLVPRFLYTWNQNSSFFSCGKILECSPYQEATAEPPANRQEATAQPPPIVPEPPQIGEPSPKGTMPTLVPLPASGITPAENRRYPEQRNRSPYFTPPKLIKASSLGKGQDMTLWMYVCQLARCLNRFFMQRKIFLGRMMPPTISAALTLI